MKYKRIRVHRGGRYKYAKVDVQDYDRLRKFKWYVCNRGYAQTTIDRITIKMHRMVLDINDPNIYVDHINHDKLDNRRYNLRKATNQQNQANQKVRKGFSSKYKGVRWVDKYPNSPWRADIMYNNKKIYIGHFANEEDAARAYNLKAIELHGEYAGLNPVDMSVPLPPKREYSSKQRGVSFHKQSGKWLARITHEGRRTNIGLFDTEDEAIVAYKEKAKELGLKDE